MNKMEKEALFIEIISEENTLRKMRFNNSPSYGPLIPFFFFFYPEHYKLFDKYTNG